jgi:GNAT superfamily N-acetyltransferase
MIEQYLVRKYGDALEGIDVYEDSKSLKLAKIKIKDEFKNKGYGSSIMDDLIDYADRTKKVVVLTPSSDYGGNKNRLVQFYKRFGFKPNKGYHKSFEYMDTMIRYPKIQTQELNEVRKIVRNIFLEL